MLISLSQTLFFKNRKWGNVLCFPFFHPLEYTFRLKFPFKEIHGAGLELTNKEELKTCMEGFSLVIVASVKPPQTPEEVPSCQARQDTLEGDMQHRLRCMSENGGMGL